MRTGVRRQCAAILAAALVASLVLPGSALAADPAAEARAHLASHEGGQPADFEVVHQRAAVVRPGAEPQLWAAKLVDRRTGEVHSVYRSGNGTIGGADLLADAVRTDQAAASPLERKADAALRAAVQNADSSGRKGRPLRVAVWLQADVAAAEATVEGRHAGIEWAGGRPVAETIEQARAVRADLWEARRAVYAAAAEALRQDVEAGGGALAYVSTSAPLVFVDLPAAGVESIAARSDVLSMGLERGWRTSMSSAGGSVSADWTSGSGDQGNGVRVAVVEYHNSSTGGDLAGQVVSSYSTTGRLATAGHPTWVAGAVGSRNSTYRGVAPGADIVSASTGGYDPSLSTDRAIIAAADWAVRPGGGDADVVNVSLGQDTATGAEEARRYFDSIGWEDGRLVVAAGGNYTTFGNWDITSPATGYNVFAVGGLNDRNTRSAGDDILWYVPGSNGAAYRDRTDASWNRHGDYNKPNVSAPAVSVRTANGIYGDGTSVASPIVAGIAAQLIARAPTLAAWPEATRAILMAGAFRRTPMPGGGVNTDHEGVGSVSAAWSNRILVRGVGPYGGYRIGAMKRGETVVQEVPVVRGQRLRASLAWSSHTSGSSNTGKADALTADLDLRVVAPDGTVTGSYSFDNSYETADIRVPTTGTLRIEIRHDRFDAAEEPYGLAWAATSPFSDIGSSPFYADILWIAQRKITLGCGGGRFCPTGIVTREQMASFLVRALDLPPTSRDYFTDDEASAHEADINALAAAGVTVGCDNGRFCPRQGVNRAQMATFLVRALDMPATSRDYFTDDDGSSHEAAINSLAAAGVTKGCGSGRYCPREQVTREQMAAFLRRALAP